MISNGQCQIQINLGRADGALKVLWAVSDLVAAERAKGFVLHPSAIHLFDEVRKAAYAIQDESSEQINLWLEHESVVS